MRVQGLTLHVSVSILHYLKKSVSILEQEDVNLMKSLNFDAYRFSISWSRIFPGTLSLTQIVACCPDTLHHFF